MGERELKTRETERTIVVIAIVDVVESIDICLIIDIFPIDKFCFGNTILYHTISNLQLCY